jgi:hypothetical protein
MCDDALLITDFINQQSNRCCAHAISHLFEVERITIITKAKNHDEDHNNGLFRAIRTGHSGFGNAPTVNLGK